MYYIGMHRTDNLEDGYLGSGRQLLKAFVEQGRSTFTKEILEFAETDEELMLLEKQYVNIDVVEDSNSYNMTTGGAGRLSYGESCNFSEEGLERLRNSGKRYIGENNPFYGKTHTEETREILSLNASKKVGELNPFFGKTHSEEFKRKASEMRLGKNKSNTPSMAIRSWNQSTGWWCTPTGCYTSDRDAALFTEIGRNCIRAWCKSPDKIVRKNYQIPEHYWGKTWKENGFYFLPKIKFDIALKEA
jgi:group I intron endonuclease